jgi:mRNA interferase RelE/StbE
MTWHIELIPEAEAQLEKLDNAIKKRIQKFLHERVLRYDNPKTSAKELSGNLSGLLSYRVGDYRIICEIHDDILLVLVVRIGHRKDVYEI